MAVVASPSDLPDFDFDDEADSTKVGTDMFAAQKVPNYPTLAVIGRYEILGRIARGGMAEVYLARAREDDGSVQHVVVKRVLSEMQHDPEMLRMFVEEGRIAVRLFHPNVCHVYEHGGTGGMTYMALEWVHGVALRDAIRRAGPRRLPLPVSVHIVAKVAGALEYVHHAAGVTGKPLGMVHQDVTPHNVMISWTGQVKLLDFGIAKKAGAGVEKGKGPQGKFEYMSPEQVCREPVDARSDVFALGCCLYESLTGVQLYGRGGPAPSMTAIVHEPPPSIRAVAPELPAELDAIVLRALQKRPDDRWPSAGAMAKALERWLASTQEKVSDQRVAISIGVMFQAAEKAALPPTAAQMTGTLQAMGLEEADAVLEKSAPRPATRAAPEPWAESFAHTSEPTEMLGDVDLGEVDEAGATTREAPNDPSFTPDALQPTPPAPSSPTPALVSRVTSTAAPAKRSLLGSLVRGTLWLVVLVVLTAGVLAYLRPDLATQVRAEIEAAVARYAGPR